MMKGDQGVSRPKLGDAPLHPQEIFNKTNASKLGDALVYFRLFVLFAFNKSDPCMLAVGEIHAPLFLEYSM